MNFNSYVRICCNPSDNAILRETWDFNGEMKDYSNPWNIISNFSGIKILK